MPDLTPANACAGSQVSREITRRLKAVNRSCPLLSTCGGQNRTKRSDGSNKGTAQRALHRLPKKPAQFFARESLLWSLLIVNGPSNLSLGIGVLILGATITDEVSSSPRCLSRQESGREGVIGQAIKACSARMSRAGEVCTATAQTLVKGGSFLFCSRQRRLFWRGCRPGFWRLRSSPCRGGWMRPPAWLSTAFSTPFSTPIFGGTTLYPNWG